MRISCVCVCVCVRACNEICVMGENLPVVVLAMRKLNEAEEPLDPSDDFSSLKKESG